MRLAPAYQNVESKLNSVKHTSGVVQELQNQFKRHCSNCETETVDLYDVTFRNIVQSFERGNYNNTMTILPRALRVMLEEREKQLGRPKIPYRKKVFVSAQEELADLLEFLDEEQKEQEYRNLEENPMLITKVWGPLDVKKYRLLKKNYSWLNFKTRVCEACYLVLTQATIETAFEHDVKRGQKAMQETIKHRDIDMFEVAKEREQQKAKEEELQRELQKKEKQQQKLTQKGSGDGNKAGSSSISITGAQKGATPLKAPPTAISVQETAKAPAVPGSSQKSVASHGGQYYFGSSMRTTGESWARNRTTTDAPSTTNAVSMQTSEDVALGTSAAAGAGAGRVSAKGGAIATEGAVGVMTRAFDSRPQTEMGASGGAHRAYYLQHARTQSQGGALTDLYAPSHLAQSDLASDADLSPSARMSNFAHRNKLGSLLAPIGDGPAKRRPEDKRHMRKNQSVSALQHSNPQNVYVAAPVSTKHVKLPPFVFQKTRGAARHTLQTQQDAMRRLTRAPPGASERSASGSYSSTALPTPSGAPSHNFVLSTMHSLKSAFSELGGEHNLDDYFVGL